MSSKADEPVHLVEDPATGDRFLVYDTEKGPRLDIRYEGETLWMTQAQIAQLFGKDVSTISRHIANVLEDGELDQSSSLQKMQTTSGRPAIIYNLDMVISVGYRVSSAQATVFRRWATATLVQFAKKGFVIDASRLKQPEAVDRVAELREIIRDIRSDGANVYRELKRICAMCQDYDPASAVAREFYQRTQAKLQGRKMQGGAPKPNMFALTSSARLSAILRPTARSALSSAKRNNCRRSHADDPHHRH
jgi:hypothetical protein